MITIFIIQSLLLQIKDGGQIQFNVTLNTV